MITLRHSDRPQLWERIPEALHGVWPEYNLHSDIADRYWKRFFADIPQFQIVLYDEASDDILAAGRTIPCFWDGTVGGLGPGIDAAIAAGFDCLDRGIQPNALCALGIEIPLRHQGKRLSGIMLREMKALAATIEATDLIVPIRPTWKERYPLTPIEGYASWTRADGSPFDPWLRTHVRLGGVIASAVPQSSRITGTIREWEAWTGMAFPDDGGYVIPGGLAPVEIDHAVDLGAYWEPGVWIVHRTDSDSGAS